MRGEVLLLVISTVCQAALLPSSSGFWADFFGGHSVCLLPASALRRRVHILQCESDGCHIRVTGCLCHSGHHVFYKTLPPQDASEQVGRNPLPSKRAQF